MKRILFALALAACGHASTTTTTPSGPPPPPPAGPKVDGSEGAVCAWGHRGERVRSEGPPAACATGLQCCYPCGIDGCDSVCQAVAACPDLP